MSPEDAEPVDVRDYDRLYAAVQSLVEQFARLDPRPTGLFVPDDQITPVVYRCLTEQKIRPGRDVLVVSCNHDQGFLVHLQPRPATISLAPEMTGRLAVEQLLWQIRTGEVNPRVRVAVEPELIAGDPRSFIERRRA